MRRAIRYKIMVILITISTVTGCRKNDPPPLSDIDIDFSECVQGSSSATFEIVSYNIETFPKSGYETIVAVADLIEEMDVDLIALQEIASESDFNKLDSLLNDYSGIFYLIDNDQWNLAYLYKTADISISIDKTKIIFEDDQSAFPRPPFEIHVTHINSGISAVVINNHLKCCEGTDNEARRKSASDQLHQYSEENYPDSPVIILGDLNDEIDDYVFGSFINDPANFRFADMDIAIGPTDWWSYPSWPSHIDHIIISNELFARFDESSVFRPDLCYPQYPLIISDHRPVYIILK